MSAGQSSGERRVAGTGFPKKYRLTKTDEFSSVFGFRKAIRSPHFLLHYRPRATGEEATARLGLVVAKRLLRRAVDRNLVRRLARENFRLLRAQLPPRDFILRLATKPGRPDRKALAEEIRAVLSKTISKR
ncbi:ribonuclease P protein component [Propionivibrio limicola]|uniref:ribonuclease P protein component n=1 Tax=Propionivibrio limicola TaxID=167645 RepID=UPI00129268B6|nr:ribonuclease P protein component [Propionivibrio limicola]